MAKAHDGGFVAQTTPFQSFTHTQLNLAVVEEASLLSLDFPDTFDEITLTIVKNGIVHTMGC